MKSWTVEQFRNHFGLIGYDGGGEIKNRKGKL